MILTLGRYHWFSSSKFWWSSLCWRHHQVPSTETLFKCISIFKSFSLIWEQSATGACNVRITALAIGLIQNCFWWNCWWWGNKLSLSSECSCGCCICWFIHLVEVSIITSDISVSTSAISVEFDMESSIFALSDSLLATVLEYTVMGYAAETWISQH